MTQELTTDQAIELFQCDQCKEGHDCEWNCVESATCSLRCPVCNERVWFQGSLQDTPRVVECPYCSSHFQNQHSR